MRRATIVAAACLAALAISSAEGTNRGTICQQCVGSKVLQQKVVQQHAVVAPVVTAPLYQYQVGTQLREDLIAERVAALVLQKLQAQAANAGAPVPEHLQAAQQLANKRCTNCHRHDGTDPKGADLRNLTALSDLQGWEAFRKVYLGTMPKNGEPLTDQEVETIMRWNVHRR